MLRQRAIPCPGYILTEVYMKQKLLFRLGVAVLLFSLLISGANASNLAVERQIFRYITEEMGLNTAAACGILANIEAESSFRPTLWGDNGTSYGLCQWHNSRFQDLKSFCLLRGYDYTTVEGQLNFLAYELKTKYPGTYAKLLNVPNTAQGAYDAAYAWCIYYERPAGMETSAAKRGRNAQMKYWMRYGDSQTDFSGNPYTGSLFDSQEEYVFYWDEESGTSSGLPGTIIRFPSATSPENSTDLPQENGQSQKPGAEGFLDRFHYVPHHLPENTASRERNIPLSCLFLSAAPVRKKESETDPQWQELPGLTPEDVELPEELQGIR